MIPCGRCGARPGALFDGYPPPADVETLLEECPPPYLSAFAQALRDHKAGKGTGGAGLLFNGSNGETQEWTVERNSKTRALTAKKRPA